MQTASAFILSFSGCVTAFIGVRLFMQGKQVLGVAFALIGAIVAINFAMAARNFAMVGG